MRLGREEIALVRFAVPGRQPYPTGSRSDDLWFQHLAIVVADMDAAYAHLSAHPGWQPISEGRSATVCRHRTAVCGRSSFAIRMAIRWN